MRDLLVVEYALSLWQPWADLCVTPDPDDPSVPVKPVENRGWPVPSTLPQWGDCPDHGRVLIDYGDDGHIADDGPDTEVGMGHAPGCWGNCDRHGCPVPVPVQADPRYPCGPIEADGPFPFRIGIHAALKVDREAVPGLAVQLLEDDDRPVAPISVLLSTAPARRGVLVGFVTVTGCHHADECGGEYGWVCSRCDQEDAYDEAGHPTVGEDGYGDWCPGPMVSALCSRWAQPGQYHWTLADPEPLDEPMPMRGRQKLWRLPQEVTADG